MTKPNPFRYFKTSPEIIRLAVMMYIRFPLSLRNVEDLLHERGIDISHETVRYWWNRFGPMFAANIRISRFDDENEECNASGTCKVYRNSRISTHLFTISLSAFAMQSPAVQRFNQERYQYSRHNFKKNQSAALNEWRQLFAT